MFIAPLCGAVWAGAAFFTRTDNRYAVIDTGLSHNPALRGELGEKQY
ncbi:MAG: hypothetical protein K2M31_04010 [Muribaculaceae bacterium]|nr:hypothetical protein [Muribaculaceae bacterium]